MVQFKICRYEEQLEKFVDTVDPLIEHAPAKLLEFAKAGEVETVIIGYISMHLMLGSHMNQKENSGKFDANASFSDQRWQRGPTCIQEP